MYGSHIQLVLVLYLSILSAVHINCDVACKGHDGKVIDWFVSYKLPKIHDARDPIIVEGLSYYYMDVKTPVWHIAPIALNKTNHAISLTISQVYKNKKDMHIMYNDEAPNGKKSEARGHTKGIVAFGAKTGFWLVHSVPNFPPSNSYSYPDSGRHYGQSFLCITLSTEKNLDLVLSQLLVTYPQIYSSIVPQEFASNKKLKAVLKGERNKSKDGSLVTLTSVKGQEFFSFAKSKEYHKDLYSEWMAPWLKSAVLAETWMNGKNPLPSTCKAKYPVKDVRHLSFGGKSIFKETQDHSKWGVAESSPWTCIGGINRMQSQLHRCGGTVCFKNHEVNKSFRLLITEADKCHKRVSHLAAKMRNQFEKL